MPLVVSEVRVKFDGEDPALPVLRDVLDRSREKLDELRGQTERYVGPFELPEPREAEVAWVRELMERQQPQGPPARLQFDPLRLRFLCWTLVPRAFAEHISARRIQTPDGVL